MSEYAAHYDPEPYRLDIVMERALCSTLARELHRRELAIDFAELAADDPATARAALHSALVIHEELIMKYSRSRYYGRVVSAKEDGRAVAEAELKKVYGYIVRIES